MGRNTRENWEMEIREKIENILIILCSIDNSHHFFYIQQHDNLSIMRTDKNM